MRMVLWLVVLAPISMASAQGPASSWTCNAAGGQSVKIDLDPSVGLVVAGTIEFKAQNGGSQGRPRASIRFVHPDGEEVPGLTFYYADPHDSLLAVALSGFGRAKPEVIGFVKPEGDIPFAVALEPSGKLSASLGGKTVSTKARPFKDGYAELSCGSATVEFGALNVPVPKK